MFAVMPRAATNSEALREVVSAAEKASIGLGSAKPTGINYTKLMLVMCKALGDAGGSVGKAAAGSDSGELEGKVEELSPARDLYGYLQLGPEPVGKDVVRSYSAGMGVAEVKGPAVVVNVLGGVVAWQRKGVEAGPGPLQELLQGWGMSLYVSKGEMYEGKAQGSCVLSVFSSDE